MSFPAETDTGFDNLFAWDSPDRGRKFDRKKGKIYIEKIARAINMDPSSYRDGHFEGTFVQL